MVRSGGTRVLFQSLADGPVELVPIIATAFLYIIDGPATRSYIHPGTDLEVSAFSLKPPTYTYSMQDCTIRDHGCIRKGFFLLRENAKHRKSRGCHTQNMEWFVQHFAHMLISDLSSLQG